jgi:hypothetical protein
MAIEGRIAKGRIEKPDGPSVPILADGKLALGCHRDTTACSIALGLMALMRLLPPTGRGALNGPRVIRIHPGSPW